MKLINWLKNNYVLTIILGIAALLRFYHIDHQSVWLDEIHTLNEANPELSISGLYDALLASDPHPPLYFILMHFVFILFGYSAFVLKMFSAIVGVAGVFSVYLLGKEIIDKKTGTYAAVLLTINYFHLLYSQEGRMYSLLFLMTTLSFYFLARFIKSPSARSAFVCGIFSALMIYCHFFALFTLVSQYLILLFFIIKPFHINRKKFFYYCSISVITSLILYIPAFNLLKKTAEMTSIWIPMPAPDVYTQIFKDLFGQSEMVLFFILLSIALFFMHLFKEKEIEKFTVDANKDNLVFTFMLLFSWISITLLLPLIRTYTSLPMLISRYFINILPAVIIIAATGISYIGNKVVRYGIVSAMLLFSFTDIVIVKNYYKTVTKTQFREVSKYIIDNNLNQEPVVTSLGWYFPYFLANKKIKMNIIDKSLEIYVAEMMKDSTKKRSFWYVDAHNRPLKIPDSIKKYLDDHFVIDHNTEKLDAWANHYSTTAVIVKEEDISRFAPLKEKNGDDFRYYIDVFEVDPQTITISGYAWFYDQDASDSYIKAALISYGKAFVINTQRVRRDDVTSYFKSQYDLGNSGFALKLDINKLPPGKYQLAILIKNDKTNKEGLILCNNFFNK